MLPLLLTTKHTKNKIRGTCRQPSSQLKSLRIAHERTIGCACPHKFSSERAGKQAVQDSTDCL